MDSTALFFDVLSPAEDVEPEPVLGEEPYLYAKRSALAKARSILAFESLNFSSLPMKNYKPDDCIVISADTIVSKNKKIFGKPSSKKEALQFLKELRKSSHQVITACAVLYKGEEVLFSESTEVLFWDCPDELLEAYANDGEGLDKAGAYAIQGKGAFLVKAIKGSWSNVVGLPTAELVEKMLARGWFIV